MNQVYQHGDELFVTLDATRRMRNLRTGLTIRPRVPFKYLGEMPQVGQVWVGKRTEGLKTVQGFAKGCVQITFEWSGRGHFGEVPLEIFLQNHTLRNFHFATGHKDAIKTEHQDRRFIAPDFSKFEEAFTPMREYCMADVQASDSLVICRNDNCYLVYKKGPAKCPYCCGKKLPLPGQLWAKGSRYVTVDRVEDGRVHYTGGSSGLRRFLNEYANVTNTVSKHSREKVGTPDGVDAAKMFVQQFGRSLRPSPTTENTPCPLNTATFNRLNTGDALDNWTKYRNTLGEKIRYANQRIKELSK